MRSCRQIIVLCFTSLRVAGGACGFYLKATE